MGTRGLKIIFLKYPLNKNLETNPALNLFYSLKIFLIINKKFIKKIKNFSLEIYM